MVLSTALDSSRTSSSRMPRRSCRLAMRCRCALSRSRSPTTRSPSGTASTPALDKFDQKHCVLDSILQRARTVSQAIVVYLAAFLCWIGADLCAALCCAQHAVGERQVWRRRRRQPRRKERAPCELAVCECVDFLRERRCAMRVNVGGLRSCEEVWERVGGRRLNRRGADGGCG